jgi:hypothetical protein
VALYARSETRYLMNAVAAELKRRTGAAIVLYCGNRQEVDFYARLDRDGLFDEIVNFEPRLRERAARLPEGDALALVARGWEERLGITLNVLAVANRHFGRGYALGGFNHPRSRMSERTSYGDVLRHYCAALAYWDEEFGARGIDLVLNGNKETAVIARARGIPYRVMNGSRHRNHHNWGWNEFFENPEIEAAYRSEMSGEFAPVALDAPYASHLEFRALFLRQRRIWALLRRGTREVVRYAYWRMRRYEKARGYYLSENLRYFYRVWADTRGLARLARTRLSDLSGRRFAFYPLHLEPETSLQGLSPEHFYQLSLIAGVSRDLPAGAILAVKEHLTAMGRRPADFYRQIAEFKNVVLLDATELGLDCVREAAVTVTICGTAGFEAALLGKPVIAFGRHNLYGFLPHVRVVTDESRLAQYLREAFDGALPNDQTRHDGARFLAAVKACSFDLRAYSYRALTEFQSEAVDDACTVLLRSLAGTGAAVAA